MHLMRNILRSNIFPSGAAVLAGAAVFIFSGCYINFSNYGTYRSSQKVARMFQDNQLPADYTYYYANTLSKPDALIGLEPGYTLDNHLWTKVDPTPGALGRLTDNLTSLPGYSVPLQGSYMVDPKGKVIGIYYSQWKGGPITVESDKKVNVHLPNTREEELIPQFEE